MSRFRRVAEGGRINRATPLKGKYNGYTLPGFEGDTLASALLANNKIIIGRSFKYHRPRGVMSAGVEEASALFTIGKGGFEQPNINAATLKFTQGLRAKSQNAWPSPRFDVMAVNQLFAPFFGAGFYYKTFMGLREKSWMFFEPFIRKAAGLGKTGTQATSQRHDTAHKFCDVLIVGSGPAGLAAALALADTKLRVTLAEQDFELGGSLLSSSDAMLQVWREETLEKLHAAENIRLLSNATVQGLYDGNQAIISIGAGQLEMLRAQTIIMACGAHERPLLFAGNDRPGVMLASALQTYANRFAVIPNQKAVLATNNDSAYSVAFDLAKLGVKCSIVDERSTIASDLLTQAAAAQVLVFTGSRIGQVNGHGKLTSVTIEGPHALTLECDALGMSGGWSPAVHLTSHGGVKPVYNQKIAAFVPGTLPWSVPMPSVV
jgi:NADPH-dependent 2,4-dienoyl-CoA reductase/sulfur reductase-like enzyme